jgi:diguanylate cyclase (GGDEF)-like protein
VWFKSRRGLTEPEVPRADAFCAHAILTEGIIEVEDATRDSRFEKSPLVAGSARVAFYAGCPVSSPDHRRIGVLAIMDEKPRVLGPDDLGTLADLARGIEGEIAATRASTEDEVTGLLNVRGFHQFADKLLKISTRSKAPMSLLYLDVLNLETAGAARDRETLLKRVATIVKSTFRQSDVLARMGPSRFCALLAENAEHATETAGARLQTAIRAWNMELDSPFKLDVVVSGARFDPDKPQSLEQLMARAESSIGAMRAVHEVGRPFA